MADEKNIQKDEDTDAISEGATEEQVEENQAAAGEEEGAKTDEG